MNPVRVNGHSLSLDHLYQVAEKHAPAHLAESAFSEMVKSRDCIEQILQSGRTVYGVNTGFGKLANIDVPPDELEELQLNLVLSHACGVGEPIPAPIVRAAMLLKVNSLAKGYSGCRPLIVDHLLTLLNKNIIPIIPCKGSVGASGDLAPLAHMTLVLLGLGEAWADGKAVPGHQALQAAGLQPIVLQAKEGLAILNGTQIMTAYAAYALYRALHLVKLADIAGAITVESLLHTKKAFDPRIQVARGFVEQMQTAQNVRNLLQNSEIVESHRNCNKVQDPYSSRCIPQVHGAVRQAINYVQSVVLTEINAATDNPLVFYQDKDVLSGGNFHGQPISLAADVLAIALAQLANISERRLENLLDPVQSGLPPFLASESGTNSGFMIAQVTAAALVSENKVLSHPASVDSIPTSANQEDFVSMGTHAARKAFEVLDHAETIIGIELLAGCQAIDFRQKMQPGRGTRIAYQTIRMAIPTLQRDRLFHTDLLAIKNLIRSNRIVERVEEEIGLL
ncbi:MAG TPA: histidine ammonia-lyase [bacterium]|nr:histidine ammonia-lyase [bacterium]HNT64935.1 histidine ammonia-lyase [bacterium]